MALDFEKLKAASWSELAANALCEFSRFVDAVERIAPDAAELQAANTDAPVEPVKCPCPPELRQKRTGVMGQDVTYECGLCHSAVVPQQPVGA